MDIFTVKNPLKITPIERICKANEEFTNLFPNNKKMISLGKVNKTIAIGIIKKNPKSYIVLIIFLIVFVFLL